MTREKCMHAQLCLTLCDTMDCCPPGFSVHVIFQARILEWIDISYSMGSNLHLLCLLHCRADSLTTAPPEKPTEKSLVSNPQLIRGKAGLEHRSLSF